MTERLAVHVFEGDIWDLHARGLYVVDPTNAFVKKSGENVMGRGISAQAKQRFPGVAADYGRALLERVRPGIPAGAYVSRSDLRDPLIIADPARRLLFAIVKRNWHEPAEADLIERSLTALASWMMANPDAQVALPRIGCGNGGLDWERVVRPLVVAFVASLPGLDRMRVVIVRPAAGTSVG